MKKKLLFAPCQSPIYRDTHFYRRGRHAHGNPQVTVSIPYLSGHPFLRFVVTLLLWALFIVCQSPIYRDTHFYQGFSARTAVGTVCVNPLSIGTPISTEVVLNEKQKRNHLCQSPIYRDTHFYFFSSIAFICLGFSCQSPIYRDTHFYELKCQNCGASELCQSPIYRDTHFYEPRGWWSARTKIEVSIPYLSGHPFLPYREEEGGLLIEYVCQSPIYRDTHFYGAPRSPAVSLKPIPVSIPYLSGHPFLLYANDGWDGKFTDLCQSPIYRDTHFYH